MGLAPVLIHFRIFQYQPSIFEILCSDFPISTIQLLGHPPFMETSISQRSKMFLSMDPMIPRTPPRSRALRARAAAHARGAAAGELATMKGDPQWGFLYHRIG